MNDYISLNYFFFVLDIKMAGQPRAPESIVDILSDDQAISVEDWNLFDLGHKCRDDLAIVQWLRQGMPIPCCHLLSSTLYRVRKLCLTGGVGMPTLVTSTVVFTHMMS